MPRVDLSALLAVLSVAAFCAALFGVIYVLDLRAEKRAAERSAGMADYAAHREWEHRPSDESLVTRFGCAPFNRGHGRSATNALRGKHDGRQFVAFDYEYVPGSASARVRSARHQRYSVLAMTLGLPTPGLAVVPTSGFDSLVNAMTDRDVEVGDPLFDEAFTVTSPSPDFARDVLHPDVVQVVMHHPELAWRLEGDSMLVIRAGRHSPPEIEAKLDFMDAVLDRIPEHVRTRLLGEPPR